MIWYISSFETKLVERSASCNIMIAILSRWICIINSRINPVWWFQKLRVRYQSKLPFVKKVFIKGGEKNSPSNRIRTSDLRISAFSSTVLRSTNWAIARCLNWTTFTWSKVLKCSKSVSQVTHLRYCQSLCCNFMIDPQHGGRLAQLVRASC